MNQKFIKLVSQLTLLLAACLLLSGCPSQCTFVFINASQEPLLVQLTGAERILIPPGERRKQLLLPTRSRAEAQAATVSVFTAKGRLLHATNACKTYASVPRGQTPHHKLYVRVTRAEIAAFADPGSVDDVGR